MPMLQVEISKPVPKFIIINLIGGAAVLGGNAFALVTHPKLRNDLWGGIPESWKPLYIASMLIAAFGYVTAMYYLIYKEGLKSKYFWGKADASVLTILLVLFLLSASMWIHSTFAYLESPSSGIWTMIQIELRTKALAILLFTIGLATTTERSQPSIHRWAVIGISFTSFHCLVLDAILWTMKFPKGEFEL
ncbi:hypothetical protein JYT44_01465 [Caldithrix abyssi]|nr:hypothetical protein [Caldithrix abyssi]